MDAFRALYDAELPYVLRTFRRLGVPAADIEDVAHELFVVVHRRLGEFEAGRPVRPWLFGIAYRVAGRYFDRPRREVVTGQRALEQAAGGTPPPPHEERELLLKALATLDLDQRAVCVLHDVESHRAPEIAELLGIPVNTVYSRLRLGREKLAVAVARLEGELR